jgi:hypothetical protein
MANEHIDIEPWLNLLQAMKSDTVWMEAMSKRIEERKHAQKQMVAFLDNYLARSGVDVCA